jgi:hypothetical protein
VSDDDAIPISAGDFGGQQFTPIFGEIFLARHQELGIGVDMEELPPELLE